MPTGYTAKLMETGETFEEFVMQCARAFGALVMMRDDPMDAPIPECAPSSYYEKSLAEHREKLTRLRGMSEAERLAHGESAKAAHIKMLEDWLEKDTAANARLHEMRKAVFQWSPPTNEHEELKKFMLEQIKISMNSLDYIATEIGTARSKTSYQYWSEELSGASRGVTYTTEEQAKDIERTRGRNLWVKQLRESLDSSRQTTAQ